MKYLFSGENFILDSQIFSELYSCTMIFNRAKYLVNQAIFHLHKRNKNDIPVISDRQHVKCSFFAKQNLDLVRFKTS